MSVRHCVLIAPAELGSPMLAVHRDYPATRTTLLAHNAKVFATEGLAWQFRNHVALQDEIRAAIGRRRKSRVAPVYLVSTLDDARVHLADRPDLQPCLFDSEVA